MGCPPMSYTVIAIKYSSGSQYKGPNHKPTTRAPLLYCFVIQNSFTCRIQLFDLSLLHFINHKTRIDYIFVQNNLKYPFCQFAKTIFYEQSKNNSQHVV